MIYRFQTFVRSTRFKWLDINNLSRDQLPPGVSLDMVFSNNWLHQLEREFHQDGVGCEVYKAPLLAPWKVPTELHVKLKSIPMLDIYKLDQDIFLSHRAREVIDAIDPGVHQYMPLRVYDQSGEELTDQPYYYLHIRRFVRVTGVKSVDEFQCNKRKFYLSDSEKEWQLGIENHPEIMGFLDTLPLWKNDKNLRMFYLDQKLLDAVRAAELTGFDLYTRVGGVKEQTVCALYQQ